MKPFYIQCILYTFLIFILYYSTTFHHMTISVISEETIAQLDIVILRILTYLDISSPVKKNKDLHFEMI